MSDYENRVRLSILHRKASDFVPMISPHIMRSIQWLRASDMEKSRVTFFSADGTFKHAEEFEVYDGSHESVHGILAIGIKAAASINIPVSKIKAAIPALEDLFTISHRDLTNSKSKPVSILYQMSIGVAEGIIESPKVFRKEVRARLRICPILRQGLIDDSIISYEEINKFHERCVPMKMVEAIVLRYRKSLHLKDPFRKGCGSGFPRITAECELNNPHMHRKGMNYEL